MSLYDHHQHLMWLRAVMAELHRLEHQNAWLDSVANHPRVDHKKMRDCRTKIANDVASLYLAPEPGACAHTTYQ